MIVPDYLGFDRCDKPDGRELYRIPRHADRLDALLESLDLRDATVVPQDWGGPIGLRRAVRHPVALGCLCEAKNERRTRGHRSRDRLLRHATSSS